MCSGVPSLGDGDDDDGTLAVQNQSSLWISGKLPR